MVNAPQEYVGRWKLGRRLGKGRGGQARVYEATAGEGGEVYALKLIQAKTAKKLSRFKREIEQHKLLSDRRAPNIMPILEDAVEVRDDGSAQGHIVMPLGVGTLEDFVGVFEARLELSLEVFVGILRGVEQAHAIGVIHRDLKPANILFIDRSLAEPLVSDFGICLLRAATVDERLTDVGETVGARWFMAPEQERGGVVEVTEAADIYALGKLLFYMLTGRYVYREELDDTFTSDEVARDPRVAIVQDAILRHTIVRHAEQRIQTAAELRALVEQMLRTFRGSAAPSPAPDSSEPAGGGGHDVPTDGEPPSGVRASYDRAILSLAEGRTRLARLQFDLACQRFEYSWSELASSTSVDPKDAAHLAEALTLEQAEGIGTIFAMARFDAAELLSDYKHYVEYVMNLTEESAGDRRLRSVPHVCAGAFYMLASVASLQRNAWSVFAFMLTAKLEWHYQSSRPLYGYAFDLPYFFHPEALERRATSAHDFYRGILSRSAIFQPIGIREAEVSNAYVQAQFLMCVRAAQLNEQGEDVSVFADFGRFYSERLAPLLFRIQNDPAFASGVLRAFGEEPTEWLAKLPERLSRIRKSFWDSAHYDWASISGWPE
jgi:serine/threonine protein kinase